MIFSFTLQWVIFYQVEKTMPLSINRLHNNWNEIFPSITVYLKNLKYLSANFNLKMALEPNRGRIENKAK